MAVIVPFPRPYIFGWFCQWAVPAFPVSKALGSSFSSSQQPSSGSSRLKMTVKKEEVIAFDVLMFFSILLLVLALVPPFMSRYIVRRKTWHTIMFSMLVFSIGEVLIVGHQLPGSSLPNENLCVVQVGIKHSTPPLWVHLGLITSYPALIIRVVSLSLWPPTPLT